MYSDVFRMYPRARVGKPSDTIKIQHARCEYKRILAHEGSMTLRYKVPYTIQARYKQDTVEYRCIPDVATGYSQDTSKIQSNTDVSQMYPARQSSTARGRALTLGRRLCLVNLLLLGRHLLRLALFLVRLLRVFLRRASVVIVDRVVDLNGGRNLDIFVASRRPGRQYPFGSRIPSSSR